VYLNLRIASLCRAGQVVGQRRLKRERERERERERREKKKKKKGGGRSSGSDAACMGTTAMQ